MSQVETGDFFSQFSYTEKFHFLDSLLSKCGATELNYLSEKLKAILRFDFIAGTPHEIQELIFGYLDVNSLVACRLVCKKWGYLISRSPNVHLVALKHLGASQMVYQTSLKCDLKLRFKEVLRSYCSLKNSVELKKHSIEGHSNSVCALFYKDGLLASSSQDGTMRISRIERNSTSFERLILCKPSTTLKFDSTGVISAQIDGDLSFQSFHDPADSLVYRGHSAAVHSFDFMRDRDLLVSGGADSKLITWSLSTGELIKTFSSHSSTITEICLEEVISDRSHATRGDVLVYSKDKNVCQVGKFAPPHFDRMIVMKSVRSVDGHTFKHGLILTPTHLVLNTRLKVHLWEKGALTLARTVSCEHLSIPDLVGWGCQFGLLVDVFGLHVVSVSTGQVLFQIPVPSLRKLDRTYTRFISGDTSWLDGFSGHDLSHLLYASAQSGTFNIEVTSWASNTN